MTRGDQHTPLLTLKQRKQRVVQALEGDRFIDILIDAKISANGQVTVGRKLGGHRAMIVVMKRIS